MQKSTTPSQPVHPNLGAGPRRATTEGTERFARRFAAEFASDFYRATSFGPTVSSIGLGTYLGDSSDAADVAYEAAVRTAVASGINLIDSAINYRSQRSELAVGSAMQSILATNTAARDELVVCSKGGYIPFDRTPPSSRDEYQAYVRRMFVESQIVHASEIVAGGHSIAPRFLRYCLAKTRQNLGLRTVDVYYVHNPEQQLSAISATELNQRLALSFEMLEEAVERSEIGCYGVATWDGLRVPSDHSAHLDLASLVGVARAVAGDGHHFKAIQLPVNLAMPEAFATASQTVSGSAMSAVQAAGDLGLTVFASASLLQAKLSRGLPPEMAQHFPAMQTDAQRSIAFVRGVEGVSSALVGMRSSEHIAENLRAGRP